MSSSMPPPAELDDLERKRRIDSAEDRATKRPNNGPLLSRPSAVPLPNYSVSSPNNDSLDDVDSVVLFQKQAIWRQMQDYKRAFERSEEKRQLLVDREALYKQTLSTLGQHLTRDLDIIAESSHSIDIFDTNNDGKLIYEESKRSQLLHELLDPDLTVVESSLSEQLRKINDLVIAVNSRVHSIINSKFPNDESDFIISCKKQESSIEKLQDKNHKLSSENISLQSKLQIQIQVSKSLEQDLESTKGLLRSAERKLDRLKFVKRDVEVGPVANNVVESPKKVDEDAQVVNDLRLKELQELQNEKLQLLGELDNFKIQVDSIPEEKIRDSPIFKNLEAEFLYHKSENEIIKQRMEKLTKEMEELQAERRTYMDQIVSEESLRRKQLEAEIKKLESDLLRVRANRDTLQQNLDLRVAKDEAEFSQISEIKVIANTRKDRINCLETDLRRLKMKIAANLGDKDLLDFFNSEDGSSFADLFEKYRDAKSQLSSILPELESYRKQTSSFNDIALTEEINKLKAELQEYKNLYGNLNPDDPKSELVERLKEKDKRVKDLELKCEYYEKTETQLSNEVEKIANAWNELEQQNSRKVLNLTQKEEQIIRLVAEKTKFDQKCAMLTKEKNTQSNLSIARKKLSDKQLEQIRKLEELNKTLSQKLTAREKELAATLSTFESSKQKISELIHQNTELKDRTERISVEFSKMKELLRDRSLKLEQEMDLKRRGLEQNEVLKRKLENSESGTLANDYKRLLKCSSCTNNFKSHVITRCFHVFCQGCIDEIIAARQRKCPTCSIAFGKEDVKQIFL
ncbi:E3 ubiquitin-protein ligase bre1 [Nowakowskiella sp. JEL0407]|nr:E3 ubiquitin-protein ligase bre1 [Nowakowskiella sp. JEL0407]